MCRQASESKRRSSSTAMEVDEQAAELDAQAKELESCAQEYLDHGLLAQSRDARTMAQDIRSQLSSLRASQGLRTEYARFDTALPQPDHRHAP